MDQFTELKEGVLEGIGQERPNTVRVFVPFPKGISMERAQEIESSLNNEELEHFHIEQIDGELYLHVKPGREIAKYIKMKKTLALKAN